MRVNCIYNEDCLVTLSHIEDSVLDLTVTSPPYNVNLGANKLNKVGYDEYDDSCPYDEYLSWLESIFREVYRCTCDNGRCVINIGDKANGSVPTHVHIVNFMLSMGWGYYTTIIWNKSEIGNRTAWGSYMSASCPSFPTPFEYILVFYKGSRKSPDLQKVGSGISSSMFVESSLALWEFSGAKKTVRKASKYNPHDVGDVHPAAFPLELPLRCIYMLSHRHALVYDPFMGSGTTALAALKSGRRFLGSEISSAYCELADRRLIDSVVMSPELFSDLRCDVKTFLAER